MVAPLLFNGPLGQIPEQPHARSVLEEELWVVVQEQPKGSSPPPGLVVDLTLDVVKGELVGLHKVSAFIQMELVDALSQLEKGEAEEVIHGFHCSRIVPLAETLVDAVPGLGHGFEVRYVCHGVIRKPSHRGNFIEVQSVRGVLLSLGFTQCLSPLWCVVPVVPIGTPLAQDALALQVVLVALVRVGSVPSHLLGLV